VCTRVKVLLFIFIFKIWCTYVPVPGTIDTVNVCQVKILLDQFNIDPWCFLSKIKTNIYTTRSMYVYSVNRIQYYIESKF
jgi:hypothetical protein